LTDEQTRFLQTIAGPALQSALAFDLPACIIAAQAILESAGKVNGKWQWGGSPLFIHANNPFGIKFGDRQGSKPYNEYVCPTTECEGGKPHDEPGDFQKFDSLKQAFNAHAILLLGPRYRAAFLVRHDWKKFADMVMVCGYSTDRPPLCSIPGCPHYAGKLVSLVEEYHLDDPATLRGLAERGAAPVVTDVELGQ
jgi:flagellum-specific peptidoglycan hydrolase FlgJ